ncbi:DUF1015 domain-containing protein [Geodermatophilus sp. YIM 151500]|uniref:DUF1015 domain-containing protein n=1 Tax=Geodermatophilus sp. YIM 151500 TaxID=2984531 RepID=UPI0021E46866|nr:DUF1015 domain-containing protein [Geodermatophilus sp. YIM 151500]MCV2488999.1 DUF1015 domain-containing protein [Geodermatophilus sp. YIM 151500]
MSVVPSSSVDSPSPGATGLDVRPFRALTYRRHDPEHLARVSSPAYDLVSPSGRDRLAGADPHNVVRLILPRGGVANGSNAGPPAADPPPAGDPLRSAAGTLASWRADGVLVRDVVPALWVYELQPPDGAPATVGWLGAVALPPAGSSAVLPHEDTYPPAVEGRRALLAATATDLEPIVLAHDPSPRAAELARDVSLRPATLAFRDDDGVWHRLWRVTDEPTLRQVVGALAATQAVIADGHHRFAAALAHHRSDPRRPGSDAVLALVTSSGPGGLRVEAIHRVVPDLPFDRAVATAATRFTVSEVGSGRDCPEAERLARTWLAEPGARGLLVSDGRRVVALTEPSAEALAAVPTEAPAAWRGLDVVLAHHALLDGPWSVPDDPATVVIAHDVSAALRTAAERSGTAVLLRPPSPADVAAVARAGARMPRKSTLFVPKPRTGLVLRPLDD